VMDTYTWSAYLKFSSRKNNSLIRCLNEFSVYGVLNLIVTVCIHLTVEAGK